MGISGIDNQRNRLHQKGVRKANVGVEQIFRREPDTLPSKLFHLGVEVRTGRARKINC
jgi:hypothetical protein